MREAMHEIGATAPWWRAHAPLLPLLRAADARAALDGAARARDLRSGGDQPLRFVAPDAAGASAYEAHIHATGEVPTRANAHDLFNALMWLALPRFKRALNALQGRALSDARRAAAPAAAGRGATRDAATLLDENGLLLACADEKVAAALARHDWHTAFVTRRAAWGVHVQAVACGHALLDKLLRPYKAITAHALVFDCTAPADAAGLCTVLDAAAARRLDAGPLQPRDLQPLPVLGIPGWWADNERPEFYADRAVFRPARCETRPARGATQAACAEAARAIPITETHA